MAELQQLLPPGWDRMLDSRTGKHYFVNHYTKTTTWDDPRLLNKTRHLPPVVHPMPVEQIVMQHGSPEFRRNYVYPSQTTPIPAFQIPARCSPKSLPLQDLGSTARSSPRNSRIQDTNLGAATSTDEAVTKISAMFPTVSDTHIRLLLKKYMKFIFPKADETMILDILSNNDNNIQKVSEILLDMGFEKRENAKPVRAMIKLDPPKVEQPQLQFILPKMRTVADKKLIHSKFEEKYKDVPPQIITIALESVEFEEERAQQILDIMVQEENDKVGSCTATYKEEQPESAEEVITEPLTNAIPISQSRQSIKSLLKTEKSDYSLKEMASFSRVIEENTDEMGGDFKSTNIIETHGANRGLVRGANQDLLLEEYVKWQGPQPTMHRGSLKSLAKGPNPALRMTRSYQACGPNADLRKGPKIGLAKGSIFSQLKAVVVGESRGK